MLLYTVIFYKVFDNQNGQNDINRQVMRNLKFKHTYHPHHEV